MASKQIKHVLGSFPHSLLKFMWAARISFYCQRDRRKEGGKNIALLDFSDIELLHASSS